MKLDDQWSAQAASMCLLDIIRRERVRCATTGYLKSGQTRPWLSDICQCLSLDCLVMRVKYIGGPLPQWPGSWRDFFVNLLFPSVWALNVELCEDQVSSTTVSGSFSSIFISVTCSSTLMTWLSAIESEFFKLSPAAWTAALSSDLSARLSLFSFSSLWMWR